MVLLPKLFPDLHQFPNVGRDLASDWTNWVSFLTHCRVHSCINTLSFESDPKKTHRWKCQWLSPQDYAAVWLLMLHEIENVCFAPAELIVMTWRTSCPSSSWEPSTPWRNPRCPWPAFTFLFSSVLGWFTPSPICVLCRPRPDLWPTRWPRSPVSPWLCKSWSLWLRTHECNTWKRKKATGMSMTVQYNV